MGTEKTFVETETTTEGRTDKEKSSELPDVKLTTISKQPEEEITDSLPTGTSVEASEKSSTGLEDAPLTETTPEKEEKSTVAYEETETILPEISSIESTKQTSADVTKSVFLTSSVKPERSSETEEIVSSTAADETATETTVRTPTSGETTDAKETTASFITSETETSQGNISSKSIPVNETSETVSGTREPTTVGESITTEIVESLSTSTKEEISEKTLIDEATPVSKGATSTEKTTTSSIESSEEETSEAISSEITSTSKAESSSSEETLETEETTMGALQTTLSDTTSVKPIVSQTSEEALTPEKSSPSIQSEKETEPTSIHPDISLADSSYSALADVFTTLSQIERKKPITQSSLLTTPSTLRSIEIHAINDTDTSASTQHPTVETEEGCIHNNRMYHSAEQIPRTDPCEFCFCFRGDVLCLHQSCPPPVPNCYATKVYGYCCPRYDCPVPAGSKNYTVKSLTDRWKRHVKPWITYEGCIVKDNFVPVGKSISTVNGPCLDCRCYSKGRLGCEPRNCKPEPPLLQRMMQAHSKT